MLVAEENGKVASVTGSHIIVTSDGKLPEGKKKIRTAPEDGVFVYNVRKFMRSNAATCINQKILVDKGDTVKKGQSLLILGGAGGVGSVAIQLARALTGWNFGNATRWWDWEDDVGLPGLIQPMEGWPDYHDTGAKTLLNGTNLASGGSAEDDLDAALLERHGLVVTPGAFAATRSCVSASSESRLANRLLSAPGSVARRATC